MMNNAQGPPQVHQAPGVGHEAVGRQQSDELSLPHIHAQRRLHRQPSHGDDDVQAQSSLPDERVGQQDQEAINFLLLELAEDDDGSVQTPNQTPPIDEDGEEGEEEDGDVEPLEDEDPPEPAPRHPPGSPLRETQAVPCVHEPVQRQLSATLIEGSIIARSMEEVEQTVGI